MTYNPKDRRNTIGASDLPCLCKTGRSLCGRHSRAKQIVDGARECTRCSLVKPVSEFGKRSGKGPLGISSICKQCYRRRKPAYTENGCRICSACKRELPLTMFSATARGGHYSRCSDCLRARGAEYRSRPDVIERNRIKAVNRREFAKSDELARMKRNARTSLRKAVKAGTVVVGKCRYESDECCGPVQGHHWSYAIEHRRDVWWVCSRHHRQLHAYGEEAMNVRSEK
jgi:hypothetical protein